MKKSIVCEDNGLCAICGRPKQANHHLIFGNGMRKEADEEGLTIPICDGCHNMQYTPFRTGQIHDNSMAEFLSKTTGQMAWERWHIAEQLAVVTNQLNSLNGNDEKISVESIVKASSEDFLRRFGRRYI